MDLRIMGLESSPLLSKLQQMMEMSGDKSSSVSLNGLSRTYVRDAKAMAATPADVTEYPNSYVLVVDMPGLKSGDIMVQVEDDNVQWREEEGGRERRDQVLEDGELKEERERGKKQKREEGD